MSDRIDAIHAALGGPQGGRRRDGASTTVFESNRTGEPVGQHLIRYTPDSTLTPSTVEGLLLHDWRARREITQPAGDLVRCGVELKGLPEWVDIEATMSWIEGDDIEGGRKGLLAALGEMWAEGESYGGSVLICVGDDGRPASEPLDTDHLQTILSWEVLDRWSICPFRRGGYGSPVDFWMLVDHAGQRLQDMPGGVPDGVSRGSQIIHPSRLVMHPGMWMPGRWRVIRDGWGASRLELLRDQRDTLATGLAQLSRLLGRSSQDVAILSEMSEMIEEQGEPWVSARARAMAQGLSSTGVLFLDGGIDGDGENEAPGRRSDSFQSLARPLGGADSIAEIQHNDWRKGSAMPEVIADGNVSKGINSGEEAGAWRAWGGTMASEQDRSLTAKFNWGLAKIFAAKDGPTGGRVPETWQTIWTPIAERDREHDAQVGKLEAEADKIYIELGTLRETETRQWRNVDGKTGTVRVESAEMLPEPGEEALAGEALALAAGGVAGEGGDVQRQALNGAQIKSLFELASLVSAGQLPLTTATWLVSVAIPGIDLAGAERALRAAEAFDPVVVEEAIAKAVVADSALFALAARSVRADSAEPLTLAVGLERWAKVWAAA